nr:SDR family NAD(P)-dependent oxidoreductase [uncultured Merdimonas sp.]
MRIALVTGASSGMGREFVRQIPGLYRHLDEIWVSARRTERLKQLKEECSVPIRIFDGDLREDATFEKIEEELKKQEPEIRMLVNAAGFGKMGGFEKISLEDQLEMIDLNCRVLTKMTGICLPCLSKGSRIINIASAAAFAPQPGFAVYAAGKAYVYRLSVALREELRARGILVTAVCPGPVDTEFFKISGELPGALKTTFRADVQKVVRTALQDAVSGKAVSVYGMPMKAARFFSGLLPDACLALFMKWANQIR